MIDVTGKEIVPGDIVLYPALSGRSLRLAAAVVVEIVENKSYRESSYYRQAPEKAKVKSFYSSFRDKKSVIETYLEWIASGKHEKQSPTLITRVDNLIKVET